VRPDRLTLPENLTEERLTDLCDWWLQVACDCGRTTYFSLLFMASRQPAERTLGEVMARLRCQMCKKEPTGLDVQSRCVVVH
jgi:hypothetical protein